jgi:hypothetical protein
MAPRGELADLRLGFACKQSWDDMVGDERVRVCKGCNRQVFNLSAMTREEAKGVLAARGVTPCVRFYQRPDGTVMTSDCPGSVPPERRRLSVVATSLATGTALAAASPAMAEPPATETGAAEAVAPADPSATPPIEERHVLMGVPLPQPTAESAPVEWSIWGRIGIGVASQPASVDASQQQDAIALHQANLVAHRVSLATNRLSATWEAAASADVTLGVASDGNIRVGAWGELRTSSGPVAGAELVVGGLPPQPYDVDAERVGSLVLRAGANAHVITGALGFGYIGSWPRHDPWIRWARHVVGARFIASLNRSTSDPRDWSALFGLEIEPIGAIHAVLDLATK